MQISTRTKGYIFAGSAFIVIIGIILGTVYFFSNRSIKDTDAQLALNSREATNPHQQVRAIRFRDTETGETSEILMDGTVNLYDKNGNLLKTGRRGFAETQNIFRRYEYLINSGKSFTGGKYEIEIETQTGVTIIESGGDTTQGDLIDDSIDFIDNTINPTPTPTAAPPTPTPSGYVPPPTPTPSPTPLPDKPDYLNAPPFTCEDYYLETGKPLKISNVYCNLDN